jgi:hypothetical protein
VVDVGEIQPAAEQGLDIAVGARLAADAVHEAAHAGVAGEVQVDVLLRLAALDAELAARPNADMP